MRHVIFFSTNWLVVYFVPFLLLNFSFINDVHIYKQINFLLNVALY